MQSGEAVEKLRKKLKKLDFKMNDPAEYLGYKVIFERGSVYAFLKRFVDDRDVLFQRIAEWFWFLVSETHEKYERANVEVAGTRRR